MRRATIYYRCHHHHHHPATIAIIAHLFVLLVHRVSLDRADDLEFNGGVDERSQHHVGQGEGRGLAVVRKGERLEHIRMQVCEMARCYECVFGV